MEIQSDHGIEQPIGYLATRDASPETSILSANPDGTLVEGANATGQNVLILSTSVMNEPNQYNVPSAR